MYNNTYFSLFSVLLLNVVRAEIDPLRPPVQKRAKTEQTELLDSSMSKVSEEQVEPENSVIAKKLYSCLENETCSTYPSHLKVDVRTDTNRKQYCCSTCMERFDRLSHLYRHMRTHTIEKPYRCSECSRTFTHPSTLTLHMTSHTGEMPYGCSICGKRFSHLLSLETHVRSHTDEKPYECSVCGERFSLLVSLKAHVRSHTDEKPYECSTCGRRFAHFSALKYHRRSHDEPCKQQFCPLTTVSKGTYKLVTSKLKSSSIIRCAISAWRK